MFNNKKLRKMEEQTRKLENRIGVLERENKVYMDEDSEFYAIFGCAPEPISLRSVVQMLLAGEDLELRCGAGTVLVKRGKS